MADDNRRGQARPTRREFLQASAAVATAWASGAVGVRGADSKGPTARGRSPRVTKLSEHLFVYHGPINVGIVRHGERALLVDCTDGGLAEALAQLGITRVDQMAFTHHHRDQTCGAYRLADAGARIAVPQDEQSLFADPAAYWNNDGNIWRVYRSFRPDHLTLVEPLPVDRTVTEGDQWDFGPATIRVLQTPGHTEGSVSYVVEADGRRVVFCGDAIYDAGRIWDVYSLQKGFSRGGRTIGGYHGFMGDRPRLVEGLQRIKGLAPDLLVPSHGRLIHTPDQAIDMLAERFERCYENYVGISALRHYFPELFTEYAGREGQMPIRPGIKPPDCLRHFGTTWMLVSETGGALVMDVGSPGIVDRIKKMLAAGEIQRVEGLWVTHYHFDHTAGIRRFQQEFDCPCIVQRRLAEVLTRPRAWRLPCLDPEPVRVDRPVEDGESWRWHEFTLTAYFYPGQTLYHDALLAETGQLRMLFVGDSHTMAGIDDYCAYNRNWLGRSEGFPYCLELIDRLRPTHMFNCHVADAFTFTAEEIRFMQQNLDQREKLFGALLPWDHPNYGLDPSWVRPHPYSQQAKPGARVRLEVVVTNHSDGPRPAACRIMPPRCFRAGPGPWIQGSVPAKTEKALPVSLAIPSHLQPGRYIVPIDIRYGPWELPRFTEAVIDVA